MNQSIIKPEPSGDFESISIYQPDWEQRFLSLVSEKKSIRYRLHEMPNFPTSVEQELGKNGYVQLILESDRWQRFLISNNQN